MKRTLSRRNWTFFLTPFLSLQLWTYINPFFGGDVFQHSVEIGALARNPFRINMKVPENNPPPLPPHTL
jgi:hypothetical protein